MWFTWLIEIIKLWLVITTALDFLSPDIDVTPILPALWDFFDDALNYIVNELDIKTLVDGVGNVLYQYPFNVPAYYALILRSLTVLEGLALYTDPNFKVLATSYAYFAKRLLTDSSPYLRDALIELLFKDGKFRWNRLENLLVEGRKDRDFFAKDALQPVLKLLLGPDGEELRILAIKEAVRVTEAFVLGSVIDAYSSMPNLVRSLIFNGNGNLSRPFVMSNAEQQRMIKLRNQVSRIWRLLQSSENFDPTTLQRILKVRIAVDCTLVLFVFVKKHPLLVLKSVQSKTTRCPQQQLKQQKHWRNNTRKANIKNHFFFQHLNYMFPIQKW